MMIKYNYSFDLLNCSRYYFFIFSWKLNKNQSNQYATKVIKAYCLCARLNNYNVTLGIARAKLNISSIMQMYSVTCFYCIQVGSSSPTFPLGMLQCPVHLFRLRNTEPKLAFEKTNNIARNIDTTFNRSSICSYKKCQRINLE